MTMPCYPQITNYGIESYSRLSSMIDELPTTDREWSKIHVLANDLSYIDFLAHAARLSREEVVIFLNDYLNDHAFRDEFSSLLSILDSKNINHAGDLRFHSVSLYVLIRALRPENFIETGVAFGKSSAMILLAMAHNNKGKLISIDLPNPEGKILADGSQTSTRSYPIGYLVPESLKKRWDLRIGNSIEILPNLVFGKNIDGFFHDSLHTYEHALAEFEIVADAMTSQGMWICDNIETGAGSAFSIILGRENLVAAAFRGFAAVRKK